MIGFIKSSPNSLGLIIACLNNDNVNFFDHKAVNNCLTDTVMRRYNLRVWHEAIFLNGFYLDWFNSNRDLESHACSYHLTVDECEEMIATARHVHDQIYKLM